MRGKICFMVVSVMLAVSTGFSHDISGYAYESPLQQAYMTKDQHDIVAGEIQPLALNQDIHTAHIQQAVLQVEKEIEKKEEEAQALAAEKERIANEQKQSASVVEEQQASLHTAGAPVDLSERDVLARIVMAEAGTEDIQGKIMVANVILNRIAAGYGNSISEIIFASGQFEPVSNGSYWSVNPTEACYEAADRALAGEDYSGGALFFVAAYADYSWFMEDLTFITQHGGHLFFR